MRYRYLNEDNLSVKGDIIIYWMNREFRILDNYVISYCHELSKKYNASLSIISYIIPGTISDRQIPFLLEGLKEVEKYCKNFNIDFNIFNNKTPLNNILINDKILCFISDFYPLKQYRNIEKDLIKRLNCPYIQFDGHNIVPCWIASDKQEYSARTIRNKIYSRLDEYLLEYPKIKKFEKFYKLYKKNDNDIIYKVRKDINWIKPGYKEGIKQLNNFIKNKIILYENKNNPNINVLSNLSPYLHFGFISSQRCLLEIKKTTFRLKDIKSKNISIDMFIEEILIRKELSDNFCFYNKNYDNIKGIPNWGFKTLQDHSKDPRNLINLNKLENAKSTNTLWNISQRELLNKGKIHGYMRMYWAKKILEWTINPVKAIKITIYLNDKYSLDGHDPNGYTGILWSIGGLHDRPFKERKIYGKIRYMKDKLYEI